MRSFVDFDFVQTVRTNMSDMGFSWSVICCFDVKSICFSETYMPKTRAIKLCYCKDHHPHRLSSTASSFYHYYSSCFGSENYSWKFMSPLNGLLLFFTFYLQIDFDRERPCLFGSLEKFSFLNQSCLWTSSLPGFLLFSHWLSFGTLKKMLCSPRSNS